MKKILVDQLQPGQKIGEPIISSNGQLLIHQGTTLTNAIIDRLHQHDVQFVKLIASDEQQTTDKGIDRKAAVHTIKKSFQSLNEPEITTKTYLAERTAKELNSVVLNVKDSLKEREELVSLLTEAFIFDDYIFDHSLNVTIYTLTIAKELGFNDNELLEIGLGALLHDIGKMKIPKQILQKTGSLTEEEFAIVKNHSSFGYEMLKDIPGIPDSVVRSVFEHHERLNGSGYPNGLKGNDIHLYAKVIGVADVFDAITTNRVYRNARLPHDALEVLYAGSGTLFEQKYIELFRQNVSVYPNGLQLSLSDGSKGIVVKQNSELTDRPVLEIFEKNGVLLEEKYEVNLAKTFNLVVIDYE
jgi:putative nucleotidyltransferase with HDIG domain